jgi:hypothetical protein
MHSLLTTTSPEWDTIFVKFFGASSLAQSDLERRQYSESFTVGTCLEYL